MECQQQQKILIVDNDERVLRVMDSFRANAGFDTRTASDGNVALDLLHSQGCDLVLVADHMDGLYRDPAAGVAVARMTLALTSMPGVYVVLSVNQDLWETTFGRQLPSAYGAIQTS